MLVNVCNGLKMRLIDSYNFFPMALKKCPKTFGLTMQLKKGEFPHFFNTKANQQYIGPFPEPKYYGIDTMSTSDRQTFLD